MTPWEGCWDSICIVDKDVSSEKEEQVLSGSIPCLVCFHLIVGLRRPIRLSQHSYHFLLSTYHSLNSTSS